MTLQDTRTSLRTVAIPRPRDERADEDTAVEEKTAAEQQPTVAPANAAETTTVGEFPWPEPWHFSRGARPRSEYWDVATARWQSRGPVIHEHER